MPHFLRSILPQLHMHALTYSLKWPYRLVYSPTITFYRTGNRFREVGDFSRVTLDQGLFLIRNIMSLIITIINQWLFVCFNKMFIEFDRDSKSQIMQ
jgi:hypothetical protein